VPQLHKTFFVPSETLDQLLNLTYRVLRFRYCDELLVLNSANLASILGESADQVRVLREELPPWVLILGVAGRDWLPEDRVEFQVNDISDIAQQFGLRLSPALPGAREGQVLAALVNPATEPYWKLRYKGGGQDVFFLTTLNRTPEFLNAMYSLSQERGYSSSDIGVYIQPLMRGVCCHCEFSLPYSPDDQKEIAKVRSLVTEGSETLMNRGAFFSRPYGAWASMAYNRDAQTTITLKKIKGIFDPNNVMNPGKLCF
jgi:FAD/FMN-containing dehydrogenase